MRSAWWVVVALACGSCAARREFATPQDAARKLVDLPMPVDGASPETSTTGVAANDAWPGCDEVRIHAVDGNDTVASIWECLSRGERLSLRWTFRGVLEDPTSLPHLSSVVGLPSRPVTAWAADPQPSDGYVLRRGPDALREIVWRVGNVRFAALVHAITDRATHRDGPARTGALSEYRVAWLEIGPKTGAPPDDDDELGFFVDVLVGKPAPAFAPCRAEPKLRLTVVCRETADDAGIVTSARWRFLGPTGPMAPAPLRIIRELPDEAVLIDARDPWKRDDVEGLGKRVVRWQRDGVDWTVELESPPVFALKVATSRFDWRESHPWEWKVRRITQEAVETAPPLPADAPRVRFGGGPVEVLHSKGKDAKDLPRPVRRDSPSYPQRARSWYVQSTVILGLLFDEQGNVDEIVVLQGAPMLDRAAIAAVMRWRYEPFRIDGQPVPWRSQFNLRFQLR